MSLGDNIRVFREKKGFSQADLAERIGLQRQNICSFEKGVKVPTVEKLVAIADVFHCSTDTLLGRDIY